jgi:hypothetical protein
MNKKVENLVKRLLDLGINEVRELQSVLESQGVLLGLTIVSDSWLREHGVKSAQPNANADSGDSHPAENLHTPGASRAQEGGR